MNTRRQTLCALTLFLIGCGGGGGGSGGADWFAGRWNADMPVAEDTCQLRSDEFRGPLTINQDENRVVAELPSGLTMSGVADATGFTATGTSPDAEGCGGRATTRFQLDFIRGGDDEDRVASILHWTWICPGFLSCDVRWVGTAERRS